MSNETLRSQIGNWCRHFNGLHHDRCEIGVVYETVRDPGRGNLPCLRDQGCAERCTQASFLSEAELDAAEAQHAARVRAYLKKGQ